MSKTADARGSRRGRPTTEREELAPFSAARVGVRLRPDVQLPPLPTGGETTQYQVPLELLVLARNKEKDRARSVAVTPVAPRPNSDEPPPSDELSDLPAAPWAVPAAAASTAHDSAASSVERGEREPLATADHATADPVPADHGTADGESAGSAREASSGSRATWVAWLVVAAALCLGAAYCAVELLHWF